MYTSQLHCASCHNDVRHAHMAKSHLHKQFMARDKDVFLAYTILLQVLKCPFQRSVCAVWKQSVADVQPTCLHP